MKSYVFVDICNTLADVNAELEKRGIRTDLYPADVPGTIWGDDFVYHDAAPMLPVIERVKHLGKLHELVYLTARPVSARSVTLDWLARHRLPLAPLIHTKGKLKADFISAYALTERVSGVVEDAPHELQAMVQAIPYLPLYIPDWSYNRHIPATERLNRTNTIAKAGA